MPTCDNIKIFGRLQCFKQEKEEISQRKHWWTKQRECIYELVLKTREPDDEAWECHISSSGQKYQQRRGALSVSITEIVHYKNSRNIIINNALC